MQTTRALIAAAAAALLAPAAAPAATLTTNDDCYVQVATDQGLVSQPIGITGGGWAPGSGWSVTGDGLVASGTADAAGAFTSTDQRAPEIDTETAKPRTITLTGQQDGVEVASVDIKVANFLVRPRNIDGNLTKKTTWVFSGFERGKTIYVHIKRGKHVYTQKAGRAKTACGTLQKRLRKLPAVPKRKIRYGRYKVFVDQRRAFSRSGLQYLATITYERIG
jgi:opacity protein-like surface antigen